MGLYWGLIRLKGVYIAGSGINTLGSHWPTGKDWTWLFTPWLGTFIMVPSIPKEVLG